MHIQQATFISSSTNFKQCPAPEKPEVAFIGRSNVGKSSLINMLVGRKKLAKTSATPGKTQLINHFLINEAYYLVDLPGYGWARVSHSQRKVWSEMVTQYLLHRKNLVEVFVLIDIRSPPQQIDLTFIQWLFIHQISFSIVFTKSDKISKQQILRQVGNFRQAIADTVGPIAHYLVISPTSQLGRIETLDYMQNLVEGAPKIFSNKQIMINNKITNFQGPIKRYLLLFFKGLAMGTVEVVPSISSSTIALLTGIYDEFLQSIQSLNKDAFRLTRNGKWNLLWNHLHGNFLVPVLIGIVVSLVGTVRLVRYLLAQYPIQTWSFFLGVSIISIIAIYQQIKKLSFSKWCYSGIGFFFAYLILQINPVVMTHEPWFLCLAGILAVCAMILPGISGSFMLVVLGQYTYMLQALQNFDWPVLGIFMAGGIIGLISMSKILLRLFHTYPDPTMALLAGFMLGSLSKAWPWKTYSLDYINGNIPGFLLEKNILPTQFQLLYKKEPYILQALLCFCIGCLVVILLKKLRTRERRIVASFS